MSHPTRRFVCGLVEPACNAMSQSHILTPAFQNEIRVAGGSPSEITRLSYTWTIGNFSSCQAEVGEEIRSPTFPAEADGKSVWCLVVNPNGLSEDSKGHVSVFLLLMSCTESEVHAEFKFSILDARLVETNVMVSERTERFLRGGYRGFDKFIRREYLLGEVSGLLADGKLTLFCEVCVFTSSSSASEQNTVVPSMVPECHLHDEFSHFFEGQKFRDVVINVNGWEFHAHKAVLAAASPVFAAMFQHDSEANCLNRVDVADVDHRVFREVLLFIYAGRAINIDTMAAELLVAADRFALGNLKSMCEVSLFSNISVSTAAELLVFADAHGADDLKGHVIEFIVANSTDVMNTAGWKTMARRQPHLVVETFRAQLYEHVVPEGPPRKRIRML